MARDKTMAFGSKPFNQEGVGVQGSRVQALALAGGGNRCWWQAGALSYLFERGWKLPPDLVGTSAGAAIAAACLTNGVQAALDACQRLYATNERLLRWRSVFKGKVEFAHQKIYPSWIDAFVNSQTFAMLKQAQSTLWVAVSRPCAQLGLGLSLGLGTLAYLIDKKVWHSIHPRLPRVLGLKQEFFQMSQCESADQAQQILCASAAAPPFMGAVRLRGAYAFDGGYVDNAPIQRFFEPASTLVMLTRHYGNRPAFFRHAGRVYWQPSRPVPVSTWDCTSKTTVGEAFALGYEDAVGAVQAGIFRVG